MLRLGKSQNLQPLPWGLWGDHCHPQRHDFRIFIYIEQNDYLKILIGGVWKNGGCGRGLVALQLFRLLKKGTIHFTFESSEPFFKFLRQKMATPKFLSDTFYENTRYEGEGQPSHHSESQKGH